MQALLDIKNITDTLNMQSNTNKTQIHSKTQQKAQRPAKPSSLLID
jgi:hypothetical protein